MSNHLQSKEFVIGAAIGSLLGTVSALLMAPKSGKRLRQDICDTYEDVCDKTQDAACRMNKKGKSFLKNMNCATSDWKDKAKCLINSASEECEDWGDHCETAKEMAIGGVVGGVLGVVAGLLLAPKAGSELRQDIADTYEDLSERTQGAASGLSRQGKKAAKSFQSQAGDWLDMAKDILDHFTGQAEDTVENVKEKGKKQLNAASDRLNDAMEIASLGYRLWQGWKGMKRGR